MRSRPERHIDHYPGDEQASHQSQKAKNIGDDVTRDDGISDSHGNDRIGMKQPFDFAPHKLDQDVQAYDLHPAPGAARRIPR